MTTSRSKAKLAIVISFSYYGSDRWIPGSLFDLMSVVNHCVKTKFDEIRVLSDFTSKMLDDDRTGVRRRVYDKVMKSVTMCSIYENHDSIRSIFKSNADLGSRFIYYSGHCSNDQLQLPSYGKISTRLFKSIAIQTTHDAFFLIDCCQCDGVNLPYKIDTESAQRKAILRGNVDINIRVRNEPMKRIVLPVNDLDYTACRIICLSSSGRGENSYSTDRGSVFTKMILSILSKYQDGDLREQSSYQDGDLRERNQRRDNHRRHKGFTATLRQFVEDIRMYTWSYQQRYTPSPVIQISRCTIYRLFGWIYKTTFDIETDTAPSMLSIVVGTTS